MYQLVYISFYLLSLLPFRFLYFLSDVLYYIIYYIAGYRKDVVTENLKKAFPNKSTAERAIIMKAFYKNLTDTFIESIKLISISEKSLLKRCKSNLDVIEGIISEGRSIQLQPGHQFNVEFYNLYYSNRLKSIAFAFVYMPVSNKNFDRLFQKIRGRFGSILVPATDFRAQKKKFENKQYALTLGADQNPSYIQGAFWMNFFNVPAPFLPGPARSAIKNETAIVFIEFKKIKRGYYEFVNTLITKNAKEASAEELTRAYRSYLEDRIRSQPANYLWTHKRWKHEFKDEYQNLWVDS